MITVSLGGSLMLDDLRLVGMSKRESLLEIEREKCCCKKNVAINLANVTPPKMSLSLGAHTGCLFP